MTIQFHDETRALIERAAFRIECQILAEMLEREEDDELIDLSVSDLAERLAKL